MADKNENERARRPRGNTSGATSQRSSASRRNSRPDLDRIGTGTHLDFDHSSYLGHRYNDHDKKIEKTEDEASSEDTDLAEKEREEGFDLEEASTRSIVPEIRDSVEDQRDIEAGPNLEKLKTSKSTKSTRSSRDPNLVSWTGLDDPANPKNWSMKRKWAATLVGTYTSTSIWLHFNL